METGRGLLLLCCRPGGQGSCLWTNHLRPEFETQLFHLEKILSIASYKKKKAAGRGGGKEGGNQTSTHGLDADTVSLRDAPSPLCTNEHTEQICLTWAWVERKISSLGTEDTAAV